MPALTEIEARARGALIDVISYDVFADLTAEPVRSRTEIRFACAEPGAATFADLTARAVSAVLNGRELGPPDDGRLALPGLLAGNTLVVEAEADGDVLMRFTDPADSAGYVLFTGYPTLAPGLFCCFDQVDLTATTTLSLALLAGWECLANGPVISRPEAGEAGRWRFGPVDGTRPFDLTIAAGPYAQAWSGTGGSGGSVRMSIRQLAALIGDDALRAGLADYMRRFGGGTASLDDLIGCWSRSSGRDLSGWAQEWLRTEGASTLRASVEAGADGTLASLAVEQDQPRTHRLGIGLYDRPGPGSVLRRRRVISAEVSGARCEIPVPPGEPVPAAVVPNDGDLTYAQISFDPASLEALAEAAMNTGDPLTEAACWNAAWRMVTTGALAGADFAGLVARRLGGGALAATHRQGQADRHCRCSHGRSTTVVEPTGL